MFVRLIRTEGAGGSIDQAALLFEHQIMPPMRPATGFLGAIMLANPATGDAIAVTYWADDGAIKANEAEMKLLRGQAVRSIAAGITGVDQFEIVVLDRVAPPKAHSFVRVNDVQGSPDKIENGIRFARETVVPLIKPLKGYQAATMGVNRHSGRTFLTSEWETAEDRAASDLVLFGTRSHARQSLGATQANHADYEALFVELDVPVAAPPT